MKDAREIRGRNKRRILSALYRHKSLPRPRLAELADVSPPTVSAVVDELLDDGLLHRRGLGDSTGGRRPVVYELNEEGRQVIAVDLGGTKIRSGIMDLAGGVSQLMEHPVDTGSGQSVWRSVHEHLDAAMERVDDGRLMGIGLAMPGLFDAERRRVLLAANLHWQDEPVAARLEERYGCPVTIENDTNAAAVGEWQFGSGARVEHMMYVTIGTGIGAGIIIDGRVYRGAGGRAGEIGHVTVDPDGPVCGCGNRGCLEAMAAGPGILRWLRGQVAQGRASSVQAVGDDGDLTVQQAARAAREGDGLARQAFRRAGTLIGRTLAGVINTLNPDRIVIGGGVARTGAPLLEPLRQACRDRALDAPSERAAVTEATLGRDSGLYGAGWSVLRHLYEG